MTLQERVDNYHKVTGFPKALQVGGDNRINGIWIMGQNYRVKSEYYGGYPAGYLKRIKALFPDKKNILHLFSGKVDKSIIDGKTIDINPDRGADVVGDAHELSKHFGEEFDLILADPPYSIEDCDHYGTTMVKRTTVVRECQKVLKPGGHLVWLDQVMPLYKKIELQPIGFIGMVKSVNHRFRVITMFEKL
jgi:hypothetical protein